MSTTDPARLQLTDRDRDLIIMAFTYHGITIDQIAARFWHSAGPSVPCYRRTGTLLKAGYLTAKRLASATGEGTGKNLLRAGPASYPLLVEHFNLPVLTVRRIAQYFPAYATHHLQICTTRLIFELAVQALPDVDLLEWVNEATLRKHPLHIALPTTAQLGSLPRSLTLVPDGQFTATCSGQRFTGFIEVDMDTHPLRRLATKLAAYLLYQRHLHPTSVYFLAPTMERVQRILDLASRTAASLQIKPASILVTTFAACTPATILAKPIWYHAESTQAFPLLPNDLLQRDHAAPFLARVAQ